ncbi:hypothetical protein IVU49_01395 [Salmonella enterica subsp. enterica serovar Worthington]|nr:hypothetical protein [Salmonella enterica subsp. enterica serovar Worthington]
MAAAPELVFRVRAIAKIINHDGELASENGCANASKVASVRMERRN